MRDWLWRIWLWDKSEMQRSSLKESYSMHAYNRLTEAKGSRQGCLWNRWKRLWQCVVRQANWSLILWSMFSKKIKFKKRWIIQNRRVTGSWRRVKQQHSSGSHNKFITFPWCPEPACPFRPKVWQTAHIREYTCQSSKMWQSMSNDALVYIGSSTVAWTDIYSYADLQIVIYTDKHNPIILRSSMKSTSTYKMYPPCSSYSVSRV